MMYPLCLRCFRMVLPPGSAEAVKASCQCEEPLYRHDHDGLAWLDVHRISDHSG